MNFFMCVEVPILACPFLSEHLIITFCMDRFLWYMVDPL